VSDLPDDVPDARAGDGPGAIVGRLARQAQALPPVRTLLRVMAAYDGAGGGLLAGGLAYAALFALLPAVLLLIGIVGIIVSDPARRLDVLTRIGDALPPIRDVAADALANLGAGAIPSSVLGIVGLVWGTSRFYASLDDAFARVFRDAPVRGLLSRTLRGIVAVVLMVVIFVLALAASSAASLAAEQVVLGVPIGEGTRTFWRFASIPLTVAIFIVACGGIYRLVPGRMVPVRALLPPAIAVGCALALFTQLFTYIAPRLVGSASEFGQLFVTIIALLIWLSTGFQALLIGAAWVRVRLEPTTSASPESPAS
jgi:membrane protein